MFDCESSNISRYGYDPKKLELDIEFRSGGTWRYRGVTQERFEDFLRAPSKGRHFLANIKNKYETEKR